MNPTEKFTMKTETTMHKKNFVIIAIAVLSLLSSTSAVEAQESQPNILFIFADDWGWGDLSCHGHPYVKTPNIDRLAEGGHRFPPLHGGQRGLFAEPHGGDDRPLSGASQH